eukprot:746332-Hanusia_phi.AAC.4
MQMLVFIVPRGIGVVVQSSSKAHGSTGHPLAVFQKVPRWNSKIHRKHAQNDLDAHHRSSFPLRDPPAPLPCSAPLLPPLLLTAPPPALPQSPALA